MKTLFLILFLALEAFAESKRVAVQIIDTIDGENGTRILRYKDAAIMEEIFLASDIENLPILIYSVTGKTRGGKSFLLDLMYKYLDSSEQNNNKKDWKEGQVPYIFDFKDGAESTTKGLWMSSKVFKRTLKDGKKVGIMLMDNQGLFDGEVTGGESVAMSGVSTILSHLQMFNMKEKITTNDLEQIILHLVPSDKVKEDKSSSPVGTNLMFVVRDFMGGKKHGYGLKNGTKYIEAEQNRGTDEYKAMWAEHRSVFNKVECVLLPHPGVYVMSEDFTNFPNLQDLEQRFVSQIDTFLKELFASENLIPPALALTGRKIHETLLGFNGKVADQSLSYFNMFIERSNQATLQIAMDNFTARFNPSYDIFKAKGLTEGILAKTNFRGQSADKFSNQLKLNMEKMINSRAMIYLVEKYRNSTTKNVTNNHQTIWPNILSDMSLFLGSDEEVKKVKHETIKAIAKVFYERLVSEEIEKLKVFCESATSQEFYNQMLIINQTESYEEFVSSSIKKCTDFYRFGISPTALNDIMLAEQIRFRNEVRRTILRKMYKVKEYMVERYQDLLGGTNLEFQNVWVWPIILKDIESLEFESDSERNQISSDIIKEIATYYYTKLKEEVNVILTNDWSALSNADFYNYYHQVKNPTIRKLMVWKKFGNFPPFSDRGLTYIWEEQEEELERLVELLIYKNLIDRGFTKEANTFRDSVKAVVSKASEKIKSFFSSAVAESYRKTREKI